jgi:hypothetical protein
MLAAGSSIQATSPGSLRMVLKVREHRKIVLQADGSRDASTFATHFQRSAADIDTIVQMLDAEQLAVSCSSHQKQDAEPLEPTYLLHVKLPSVPGVGVTTKPGGVTSSVLKSLKLTDGCLFCSRVTSAAMTHALYDVSLRKPVTVGPAAVLASATEKLPRADGSGSVAPDGTVSANSCSNSSSKEHHVNVTPSQPPQA